MSELHLQEVAAGVRRILAPNPSALTGPGTNSYLVGHGAGLALIDPGPALPAHQASLLAALRPGERISHILVTHAHKDHSALSPEMAQATGAPILAFGDAASGRSYMMQRLAEAGLSAGGEGADAAFQPDVLLKDGAVITGDTWALQAVHTPGHMGGHLCFALGDLLFSGDHVMGWSSSLFSPPDGDMGAYMTSLARLSGQAWSRFLPGHGDPIEDPTARVAALATHRRAREAAILACLGTSEMTPDALARTIYRDVPPTLIAAASRNVLAHLIDLSVRNLVVTTDVPHPAARFALAPKV